jgi:hypothetical protein
LARAQRAESAETDGYQAELVKGQGSAKRTDPRAAEINKVTARICKHGRSIKDFKTATVVTEAPQAVAQTVVDHDLTEKEAVEVWSFTFTTTIYKKATLQRLLQKKDRIVPSP